MTDDLREFQVEPDPAFVGRLERDLLRQLGEAPASTVPTPMGDNLVTLDLISASPGTQRQRRSRLTATIATAAAIFVAALIAVRVGGDDSPPSDVTNTSLHDVSFDLSWPGLSDLESAACIETDIAYTWAQSSRCFRQFTGEVELTGDLSGTALWMMLGSRGEAADEEDSAVKVPAAFTGTYLVQATVEGCGTGEFMITEQLRFDGWESGAFSGTWEVVPGSGRDELSAISGGGEVPGDFPSRETTQATRTGQLACG